MKYVCFIKKEFQRQIFVKVLKDANNEIYHLENIIHKEFIFEYKRMLNFWKNSYTYFVHLKTICYSFAVLQSILRLYSNESSYLSF